VIGLSAAIEFYVNIAEFPLPVELLLLPALVFLAALSAVARLKPETRPAKRFVDALLAVVGVAILVRTGVWVADRRCRPTGRRGAVDGAASQASSELLDSCKGRMAQIFDWRRSPVDARNAQPERRPDG
jgi:hypothetical protein